MPTFHQIARPDDLPPLDASHEQLIVDFKAVVDEGNAFELAKDVAAFANAHGGVILVGAAEVDGRLVRYVPLAHERATAIRDAFSRAVRDRCCPPPMVDPCVLERDGGWVVAVNCFPSPGQPVGVKVRCDGAQGFGGDGFVFPVRAAVDTTFYRPEQLPMLTVAEIRRVTALLESIPRGQPCVMLQSSARNIHPVACAIQRINAQENVLVLDVPALPVISVPLDAVRSVWRQPDAVHWTIALNGFLERDATAWRFTPT